MSTTWSQQWQAMPSFLIGEYMFIALAMLALAHARGCGRAHLLAWVAALVAGTANDLFFMALPLVDNFWQAQATIMLTPRLPLYIPCVYVCFMYLPWAAVRRLGLPPFAAASATGLVAILFYAPYDIVGAKFLWWTWHDTDQPIANRILGAPIGSTMWVIVFVAAWSWLLDRVARRDPSVHARTFVKALALVALASTPIMMVELGILQQLDGGIPGIRGLVVLVLLHVVLIVRGWRRRVPPRESPRADRWLRVALPLYFAILASIMAVFDPATHVSTGVHQTYGPCGVEARDIAGHVRHEYLCAQELEEDFGFDCVDALPADRSTWYTVCGRPHRGFATWMTAVASLGLLGSAAFWWMLRRRDR